MNLWPYDSITLQLYNSMHSSEGGPATLCVPTEPTWKTEFVINILSVWLTTRKRL